MKPTWSFERNEFLISEGPNDAGISSFTNNRAGGLVRELLQNSIDARKSEDQPVEVSFEISNLPVDDFDIDGLIMALDASCKSLDNDDRHRKQFRRGLNMLRSAKKSGYLSALVVTDCNTTGAPDIDGRQDKWWSLTRSVGKSAKDRSDSGGSFGIGKHAAFAAADMRSVLYSTAYQNGNSLERRFTGKSILVSHDIKDEHFKSTGYLIDDSDAEDFIPEALNLSSPGTAIAILGFPPSATKIQTWKKEAVEALVASFFHALVRKNLVVHLLGQTIDHESIDSIADGIEDDRLRNLIAVSRAGITNHISIEGIGRVNLRISVDNDNKNQSKILGIVRDSGMLITDRLGSMRISPSQRMIQFPRTWHGFTAVVECLSQGSYSLLREAEGPSHNEISPDNADDVDRDKVRKGIRELGKWVRQEIETLAKPPEPSRSDNASEIADLLSLPGEGTPSRSQSGSAKVEISEPRLSPILPAGLGIRGGGQRRGQDSLAEGGGNGGGIRHRNQDRRKRKTRRKKSREEAPVTFHDVRRLPSSLNQWPDHAAKFALDMQSEIPKRIRLYAVGEDGRAEQLPLERAYFDGRRLKVSKGEIVELDEKRMGNRRVELEMKAIRPIGDKRLEIRAT